MSIYLAFPELDVDAISGILELRLVILLVMGSRKDLPFLSLHVCVFLLFSSLLFFGFPRCLVLPHCTISLPALTTLILREGLLEGSFR